METHMESEVAMPACQAPVCWICLDENPQDAPCKCSNPVHRTCLARWQLERLGRSEERECRFCKSLLPPWQEVLLPQRVRPATEATVNVHAPDGSLHRIPLRPGLAGRRAFLRAVRQALRLPPREQLDLSFEVALPTSATGTLPALISTRDFCLASHIATLNAGIRSARSDKTAGAPEEEEGEASGQDSSKAPAAAVGEASGSEGAQGSQGGRQNGGAKRLRR
ncbi:hypothetical protein Agub_g2152 [Astrephomene gubernaculifera]|uniref:RING-CH-type domain-containing protein n=1 Tax=Astrephomene gubernaculifera TaxID=47775 RepID=A0AAD3HHG3_9CHLO|nr:hypothetical protein Agub_g2152 [Astrephomene gubernaculifera]